MQTETLALLLVVLSLGMIALKRFADMRLALEEIVAERTRSLEDKTRQLELLATTDTLTGLFNRRYADEYLLEQGRLLEMTGETLTVAFADIDLFKQINDLHSHAVGDEVLKRVADMLRVCCRGRHMIARYGGEEFLICFLRTDLKGAQAVCEETRAAIESFAWRTLGLDQAVTISFGLAECRADSEIQAVLTTADQRLYEAKRRGRNLVVVREAERATA